ncbi:MAG: hypothetical protein U5L11_09190 [Arhodomonas sp.]|nr:hypothetical protein [Arhodomonas sp.]
MWPTTARSAISRAEPMPGGHRLRRCHRPRCATSCAGQGEAVQPIGAAAAMAYRNVADPATINVMRKAMLAVGVTALSASPISVATALAGLAAAARPPGRRAEKRPKHTRDRSNVRPRWCHSSSSPCPERPGAVPRARHARVEDEQDRCPSSAIRATVTEDSDAASLLPGLRFRAAVQPRSAWRPMAMLSPGRRADRAAAGLPLAAATRRPSGGDLQEGPARSPREQPGALPPAWRQAPLNYMDIKTVVVSCGTCMDQLGAVPVRADLPRLPSAADIHEYLQEKGIGHRRRRRGAVPLPRSRATRP